MAKVLITGSNGYIGAGVVKEIEKLGYKTICTDVSNTNNPSTIVADIFDIEDPYNYFGKPDVLIHVAWRDGFVHNSLAHMEDLPKHYEFIKKMIDSGLKDVNVLGSMHEVGFYEGEVSEETPCNPLSLYGIAKNSLRQALTIYSKEKDVNFKWLRGYYIVNNDERGNNIFSKIIKANKEGKDKFPFTSGTNKYDFLSYTDFIKYIALASTQEEVDGIIEICSGEAIALKDKVEEFINNNNLNIKLDYGVFPDRPYDSKEIWGSSKKINQIINHRRD